MGEGWNSEWIRVDGEEESLVDNREWKGGESAVFIRLETEEKTAVD